MFTDLITAICVAPLLQHIPFHSKILVPFLPKPFLVAPCRHCFCAVEHFTTNSCKLAVRKASPHMVFGLVLLVSYLQLAPPPPRASKGELDLWSSAPSGRLPHLLHSAPSYKHFVYKQNEINVIFQVDKKLYSIIFTIDTHYRKGEQSNPYNIFTGVSTCSSTHSSVSKHQLFLRILKPRQHPSIMSGVMNSSLSLNHLNFLYLRQTQRKSLHKRKKK